MGNTDQSGDHLQDFVWEAISNHGARMISAERLDGCNGLMLTPDADHLFDLGFISFSNSGNALISPNLPSDDLAKLGPKGSCDKNCSLFNDKQAAYLEFHRNEIFMK